MTREDTEATSADEPDALRAQGIDPGKKDQIQILRPDWKIPGVNAGFTLRTGGVSKPPYDSLNLAMHVGDNPDDVRENRRRLIDHASLPEEPRWLKQVHGTRVVHASDVERDITEADAVWTDQPGQVCAVMVADCVPILLAAKDGSCVAAVHAGWRGLAAGVIEATIAAMPVAGEELLAVIGPCISAEHYEVGEEVIDHLRAAEITPCWQSVPLIADCVKLDLVATVRAFLCNCGVDCACAERLCTFKSVSMLYSYRRSGLTGRSIGMIQRHDRPMCS